MPRPREPRNLIQERLHELHKDKFQVSRLNHVANRRQINQHAILRDLQGHKIHTTREHSLGGQKLFGIHIPNAMGRNKEEIRTAIKNVHGHQVHVTFGGREHPFQQPEKYTYPKEKIPEQVKENLGEHDLEIELDHNNIHDGKLGIKIKSQGRDIPEEHMGIIQNFLEGLFRGPITAAQVDFKKDTNTLEYSKRPTERREPQERLEQVPEPTHEKVGPFTRPIQRISEREPTPEEKRLVRQDSLIDVHDPHKQVPTEHGRTLGMKKVTPEELRHSDWSKDNLFRQAVLEGLEENTANAKIGEEHFIHFNRMEEEGYEKALAKYKEFWERNGRNPNDPLIKLINKRHELVVELTKYTKIAQNYTKRFREIPGVDVLQRTPYHSAMERVKSELASINQKLIHTLQEHGVTQQHVAHDRPVEVPENAPGEEVHTGHHTPVAPAPEILEIDYGNRHHDFRILRPHNREDPIVVEVGEPKSVFKRTVKRKFRKSKVVDESEIVRRDIREKVKRHLELSNSDNVHVIFHGEEGDPSVITTVDVEGHPGERHDPSVEIVVPKRPEVTRPRETREQKRKRKDQDLLLIAHNRGLDFHLRVRARKEDHPALHIPDKVLDNFANTIVDIPALKPSPLHEEDLHFGEVPTEEWKEQRKRYYAALREKLADKYEEALIACGRKVKPKDFEAYCRVAFEDVKYVSYQPIALPFIWPSLTRMNDFLKYKKKTRRMDPNELQELRDEAKLEGVPPSLSYWYAFVGGIHGPNREMVKHFLEAHRLKEEQKSSRDLPHAPEIDVMHGNDVKRVRLINPENAHAEYKKGRSYLRKLRRQRIDEPSITENVVHLVDEVLDPIVTDYNERIGADTLLDKNNEENRKLFRRYRDAPTALSLHIKDLIREDKIKELNGEKDSRETTNLVLDLGAIDDYVLKLNERKFRAEHGLADPLKRLVFERMFEVIDKKAGEACLKYELRKDSCYNVIDFFTDKIFEKIRDTDLDEIKSDPEAFIAKLKDGLIELERVVHYARDKQVYALWNGNPHDPNPPGRRLNWEHVEFILKYKNIDIHERNHLQEAYNELYARGRDNSKGITALTNYKDKIELGTYPFTFTGRFKSYAEWNQYITDILEYKKSFVGTYGANWVNHPLYYNQFRRALEKDRQALKFIESIFETAADVNAIKSTQIQTALRDKQALLLKLPEILRPLVDIEVGAKMKEQIFDYITELVEKETIDPSEYGILSEHIKRIAEDLRKARFEIDKIYEKTERDFRTAESTEREASDDFTRLKAWQDLYLLQQEKKAQYEQLGFDKQKIDSLLFQHERVEKRVEQLVKKIGEFEKEIEEIKADPSEYYGVLIHKIGEYIENTREIKVSPVREKHAELKRYVSDLTRKIKAANDALKDVITKSSKTASERLEKIEEHRALFERMANIDSKTREFNGSVYDRKVKAIEDELLGDGPNSISTQFEKEVNEFISELETKKKVDDYQNEVDRLPDFKDKFEKWLDRIGKKDLLEEFMRAVREKNQGVIDKDSEFDAKHQEYVKTFTDGLIEKLDELDEKDLSSLKDKLKELAKLFGEQVGKYDSEFLDAESGQGFVVVSEDNSDTIDRTKNDWTATETELEFLADNASLDEKISDGTTNLDDIIATTRASGATETVRFLEALKTKLEGIKSAKEANLASVEGLYDYDALLNADAITVTDVEAIQTALLETDAALEKRIKIENEDLQKDYDENIKPNKEEVDPDRVDAIEAKREKVRKLKDELSDVANEDSLDAMIDKAKEVTSENDRYSGEFTDTVDPVKKLLNKLEEIRGEQLTETTSKLGEADNEINGEWDLRVPLSLENIDERLQALVKAVPNLEEKLNELLTEFEGKYEESGFIRGHDDIQRIFLRASKLKEKLEAISDATALHEKIRLVNEIGDEYENLRDNLQESFGFLERTIKSNVATAVENFEETEKPFSLPDLDDVNLSRLNDALSDAATNYEKLAEEVIGKVKTDVTKGEKGETRESLSPADEAKIFWQDTLAVELGELADTNKSLDQKIRELETKINEQGAGVNDVRQKILDKLKELKLHKVTQIDNKTAELKEIDVLDRSRAEFSADHTLAELKRNVERVAEEYGNLGEEYSKWYTDHIEDSDNLTLETDSARELRESWVKAGENIRTVIEGKSSVQEIVDTAKDEKWNELEGDPRRTIFDNLEAILDEKKNIVERRANRLLDRASAVWGSDVREKIEGKGVFDQLEELKSLLKGLQDKVGVIAEEIPELLETTKTIGTAEVKRKTEAIDLMKVKYGDIASAETLKEKIELIDTALAEELSDPYRDNLNDLKSYLVGLRSSIVREVGEKVEELQSKENEATLNWDVNFPSVKNLSSIRNLLDRFEKHFTGPKGLVKEFEKYFKKIAQKGASEDIKAEFNDVVAGWNKVGEEIKSIRDQASIEAMLSITETILSDSSRTVLDRDPVIAIQDALKRRIGKVEGDIEDLRKSVQRENVTYEYPTHLTDTRLIEGMPRRLQEALEGIGYARDEFKKKVEKKFGENYPDSFEEIINGQAKLFDDQIDKIQEILDEVDWDKSLTIAERAKREFRGTIPNVFIRISDEIRAHLDKKLSFEERLRDLKDQDIWSKKHSNFVKGKTVDDVKSELNTQLQNAVKVVDGLVDEIEQTVRDENIRDRESLSVKERQVRDWGIIASGFDEIFAAETLGEKLEIANRLKERNIEPNPFVKLATDLETVFGKIHDDAERKVNKVRFGALGEEELRTALGDLEKVRGVDPKLDSDISDLVSTQPKKDTREPEIEFADEEPGKVPAKEEGTLSDLEAALAPEKFKLVIYPVEVKKKEGEDPPFEIETDSLWGHTFVQAEKLREALREGKDAVEEKVKEIEGYLDVAREELAQAIREDNADRIKTARENLISLENAIRILELGFAGGRKKLDGQETVVKLHFESAIDKFEGCKKSAQDRLDELSVKLDENNLDALRHYYESIRTEIRDKYGFKGATPTEEERIAFEAMKHFEEKGDDENRLSAMLALGKLRLDRVNATSLELLLTKAIDDARAYKKLDSPKKAADFVFDKIRVRAPEPKKEVVPEGTPDSIDALKKEISENVGSDFIADAIISKARQDTRLHDVLLEGTGLRKLTEKARDLVTRGHPDWVDVSKFHLEKQIFDALNETNLNDFYKPTHLVNEIYDYCKLLCKQGGIENPTAEQIFEKFKQNLTKKDPPTVKKKFLEEVKDWKDNPPETESKDKEPPPGPDKDGTGEKPKRDTGEPSGKPEDTGTGDRETELSDSVKDALEFSIRKSEFNKLINEDESKLEKDAKELLDVFTRFHEAYASRWDSGDKNFIRTVFSKLKEKIKEEINDKFGSKANAADLTKISDLDVLRYLTKKGLEIDGETFKASIEDAVNLDIRVDLSRAIFGPNSLGDYVLAALEKAKELGFSDYSRIGVLAKILQFAEKNGVSYEEYFNFLKKQLKENYANGDFNSIKDENDYFLFFTDKGFEVKQKDKEEKIPASLNLDRLDILFKKEKEEKILGEYRTALDAGQPDKNVLLDAEQANERFVNHLAEKTPYSRDQLAGLDDLVDLRKIFCDATAKNLLETIDPFGDEAQIRDALKHFVPDENIDAVLKVVRNITSIAIADVLTKKMGSADPEEKQKLLAAHNINKSDYETKPGGLSDLDYFTQQIIVNTHGKSIKEVLTSKKVSADLDSMRDKAREELVAAISPWVDAKLLSKPEGEEIGLGDLTGINAHALEDGFRVVKEELVGRDFKSEFPDAFIALKEQVIEEADGLTYGEVYDWFMNDPKADTTRQIHEDDIALLKRSIDQNNSDRFKSQLEELIRYNGTYVDDALKYHGKEKPAAEAREESVAGEDAEVYNYLTQNEYTKEDARDFISTMKAHEITLTPLNVYRLLDIRERILERGLEVDNPFVDAYRFLDFALRWTEGITRDKILDESTDDTGGRSTGSLFDGVFEKYVDGVNAFYEDYKALEGVTKNEFEHLEGDDVSNVEALIDYNLTKTRLEDQGKIIVGEKFDIERICGDILNHYPDEKKGGTSFVQIVDAIRNISPETPIVLAEGKKFDNTNDLLEFLYSGKEPISIDEGDVPPVEPDINTGPNKPSGTDDRPSEMFNTQITDKLDLKSGDFSAQEIQDSNRFIEEHGAFVYDALAAKFKSEGIESDADIARKILELDESGIEAGLVDHVKSEIQEELETNNITGDVDDIYRYCKAKAGEGASQETILNTYHELLTRQHDENLSSFVEAVSNWILEESRTITPPGGIKLEGKLAEELRAREPGVDDSQLLVNLSKVLSEGHEEEISPEDVSAWVDMASKVTEINSDIDLGDFLDVVKDGLGVGTRFEAFKKLEAIEREPITVYEQECNSLTQVVDALESKLENIAPSSILVDAFNKTEIDREEFLIELQDAIDEFDGDYDDIITPPQPETDKRLLKEHIGKLKEDFLREIKEQFEKGSKDDKKAALSKLFRDKQKGPMAFAAEPLPATKKRDERETKRYAESDKDTTKIDTRENTLYALTHDLPGFDKASLSVSLDKLVDGKIVSEKIPISVFLGELSDEKLAELDLTSNTRFWKMLDLYAKQKREEGDPEFAGDYHLYEEWFDVAQKLDQMGETGISPPEVVAIHEITHSFRSMTKIINYSALSEGKILESIEEKKRYEELIRKSPDEPVSLGKIAQTHNFEINFGTILELSDLKQSISLKQFLEDVAKNSVKSGEKIPSTGEVLDKLLRGEAIRLYPGIEGYEPTRELTELITQLYEPIAVEPDEGEEPIPVITEGTKDERNAELQDLAPNNTAEFLQVESQLPDLIDMADLVEYIKKTQKDVNSNEAAVEKIVKDVKVDKKGSLVIGEELSKLINACYGERAAEEFSKLAPTVIQNVRKLIEYGISNGLETRFDFPYRKLKEDYQKFFEEDAESRKNRNLLEEHPEKMPVIPEEDFTQQDVLNWSIENGELEPVLVETFKLNPELFQDVTESLGMNNYAEKIISKLEKGSLQPMKATVVNGKKVDPKQAFFEKSLNERFFDLVLNESLEKIAKKHTTEIREFFKKKEPEIAEVLSRETELLTAIKDYGSLSHSSLDLDPSGTIATISRTNLEDEISAAKSVAATLKQIKLTEGEEAASRVVGAIDDVLTGSGIWNISSFDVMTHLQNLFKPELDPEAGTHAISNPVEGQSDLYNFAATLEPALVPEGHAKPSLTINGEPADPITVIQTAVKNIGVKDALPEPDPNITKETRTRFNEIRDRVLGKVDLQLKIQGQSVAISSDELVKAYNSVLEEHPGLDESLLDYYAIEKIAEQKNASQNSVYHQERVAAEVLQKYFETGLNGFYPKKGASAALYLVRAAQEYLIAHHKKLEPFDVFESFDDKVLELLKQTKEQSDEHKDARKPNLETLIKFFNKRYGFTPALSHQLTAHNWQRPKTNNELSVLEEILEKTKEDTPGTGPSGRKAPKVPNQMDVGEGWGDESQFTPVKDETFDEKTKEKDVKTRIMKKANLEEKEFGDFYPFAMRLIKTVYPSMTEEELTERLEQDYETYLKNFSTLKGLKEKQFGSIKEALGRSGFDISFRDYFDYFFPIVHNNPKYEKAILQLKFDQLFFGKRVRELKQKLGNIEDLLKEGKTGSVDKALVVFGLKFERMLQDRVEEIGHRLLIDSINLQDFLHNFVIEYKDKTGLDVSLVDALAEMRNFVDDYPLRIDKKVYRNLDDLLVDVFKNFDDLQQETPIQEKKRVTKKIDHKASLVKKLEPLFEGYEPVGNEKPSLDNFLKFFRQLKKVPNNIEDTRLILLLNDYEKQVAPQSKFGTLEAMVTEYLRAKKMLAEKRIGERATGKKESAEKVVREKVASLFGKYAPVGEEQPSLEQFLGFVRANFESLADLNDTDLFEALNTKEKFRTDEDVYEGLDGVLDFYLNSLKAYEKEKQSEQERKPAGINYETEVKEKVDLLFGRYDSVGKEKPRLDEFLDFVRSNFETLSKLDDENLFARLHSNQAFVAVDGEMYPNLAEVVNFYFKYLEASEREIINREGVTFSATESFIGRLLKSKTPAGQNIPKISEFKLFITGNFKFPKGDNTLIKADAKIKRGKTLDVLESFSAEKPLVFAETEYGSLRELVPLFFRVRRLEDKIGVSLKSKKKTVEGFLNFVRLSFLRNASANEILDALNNISSNPLIYGDTRYNSVEEVVDAFIPNQ